MIPRVEFDPTATAPLDGIRVIDLSRLVAGNMVSLQLADQGAEVIKIEDPKVGDPLRAWRVKGLSLHWKVYARNKKSLAINLRPQAGRDALLDLLATSQVLIENYRPGTLEQMGLGPDVLHARNPSLIIVRITGFGQDGPYRDRPGFGTLVEAMSGFASKNGFEDRPPVLPPLAMADMVAGLYGAYAVMVALRVVEQGGKGQIIDLPLLEPMISVLGPDAATYRVSGEKPRRTGSRSLTTSPRNVYGTSDGRFIAISASIQAMAERLFRAIGRLGSGRTPTGSVTSTPATGSSRRGSPSGHCRTIWRCSRRRRSPRPRSMRSISCWTIRTCRRAGFWWRHRTTKRVRC